MAEYVDKARAAALRPAQVDCGTGVQEDQTEPGLPAGPAAYSAEGQTEVAAHVRWPQPA